MPIRLRPLSCPSPPTTQDVTSVKLAVAKGESLHVLSERTGFVVVFTISVAIGLWWAGKIPTAFAAVLGLAAVLIWLGIYFAAELHRLRARALLELVGYGLRYKLPTDDVAIRIEKKIISIEVAMLVTLIAIALIGMVWVSGTDSEYLFVMYAGLLLPVVTAILLLPSLLKGAETTMHELRSDKT